MANIKLGDESLTGVEKIQCPNADEEGEYVEFQVITDTPTNGGGKIGVQAVVKKADAARNIAVNMSTINVEMKKEGE